MYQDAQFLKDFFNKSTKKNFVKWSNLALQKYKQDETLENLTEVYSSLGFFIQNTAAQFNKKTYYSYQECLSYAMEGVARAIKSYNIGKGKNFYSWLVLCCKSVFSSKHPKTSKSRSMIYYYDPEIILEFDQDIKDMEMERYFNTPFNLSSSIIISHINKLIKKLKDTPIKRKFKGCPDKYAFVKDYDKIIYDRYINGLSYKELSVKYNDTIHNLQQRVFIIFKHISRDEQLKAWFNSLDN